MAAALRWRARPDDVLLLSGGIDSVCAWVLLDYPPTRHFQFATVYAAREEERYRALVLRRHQLPVVDRSLAWLAEAPGSADLPLRNLHMCTVSWSLGAGRVILAAACDWAPDKRWLFAVSTGWAGRVAWSGGPRRHLAVVLPFLRWTKARLLRTAVAVGGDWFVPYLYSCYTGTLPPCGYCHACRRARIAFTAAGVLPPYPTWGPPPVTSWQELLRWSLETAPPRWAPGSTLNALRRARELWQCWGALQRGAALGPPGRAGGAL